MPGSLRLALRASYGEDFTSVGRLRIILVMDRHPAHVAAATKRWLNEHRHRIEVHFLPGYAPELNPDEHVWARLKGMFHQDWLGPDERLDTEVELAMNELRKDPALVKSFFQHPDVKYVQDALGW
jgi:DDE superfamily endonuclease